MFEIVFSGGNGRPELEDRDGLPDVLQPVLAEIGDGQRLADGVPRCTRHEDLATVSGRRDPRTEMHVLADVALLTKQRAARVETDPDAHRPLAE